MAGVPETTQPRRLLGPEDDVNFLEQDSEALHQVFVNQKQRLWNALGAEHVDSIHHVGSSAIKGMPGPPSVDMIMFVHTWPPSDTVLNALKELGLFSMGDAPHYANDKWFGFVASPDKSIQDIGSGVVHVVHKDNEEAVSKQILWVEYCNNNKEAFEAYKQIKLEAKTTGNFSAYKKKKSEMIGVWFPRAVEWKKQQQAKGN